MSRTGRALVVVLLAARAAGAAVMPDPLRPPASGGLEAIDRNLAKLEIHARLLVVGAHPDDEDTALLALVARGMHGEAAYLSLSRGEGGQNLIGAEMGVALGLLRTQELLAARRLDGARQFFTRAFDFGYTASLAETFERWPREVLLEDTVRVIRRFRPQVVVSVFPNDGGGGHGQHQAAGWAAHEAFGAAADPAAFPGLAREGLAPWTPRALYRSTWFDRAQTTMVLSTGVVEPFSGRSIYQLAMASRSQHRSQDMGRLQEIGPKETRLGWVSGGDGAGGAMVFAGVDTRLRAIALELPAGAGREALWGSLTKVEEIARSARARLSASDGGAAAASGAREALARLRAARSRVTDAAVLALLEEKIAAAEAAWLAARGIVIDATVERETVADGEEVAVLVSLWNGGRETVHVNGLGLVSRDGWTGGAATPAFAAQDLLPGRLLQWTVTARAADRGGDTAASASVPYFLRRPLAGDVYDWSAAPADVLGLPFEAPPLVARLSLEDRGEESSPLALERVVVHRRNDQAAGEIRRPLRAARAVEVALGPDLLIVPNGASEAASRERALEATLRSNSLRPTTGRLVWEVPAGWSAPPAVPFTLPPLGTTVIAARLGLPRPLPAGRVAVSARAVLDGGGGQMDASLALVDHPHVPPTPYPRRAETTVVAADLRFAPRRVAYVAGAGDRVPDAVRQAGFALDLLGGVELGRHSASDLLAAYDTIVIGSRAYETEPALAEADARLRQFVEAGGALIVLYQQYAFIEGGFAPRPLSIARPHDRVTDEQAPVTALLPQHPLLRFPNAIGPEDWGGWVQERGLYFARDWDPAYQPLLELPGPGGEPLRGALLVARVGRGVYVYTGLAFFRQLPAGVPGAHRLFANLLAIDPGTL